MLGKRPNNYCEGDKNRLFPRKIGEAPSLVVFKDSLDGALNNLVKWKVSLVTAGD